MLFSFQSKQETYRKMKKWLCFVVLFSACFSKIFSQKPALSFEYCKNISEINLSEYLHVLASDSLEGRETGYPGQALTADYIASKFSTFGVSPPPFNKGSFYQDYPLELMSPEGVTINARNKKFQFLKDFYYLPGLQDTTIHTENCVFLGYGIDSKNYTDYPPNIKLKGKVLIILSGEPTDKKGNSLVTNSKELSEWSKNWKKKIVYAKTFGPSAILIVLNSLKKSVIQDKFKIEAQTIKTSVHGKENIPCFYISMPMAKAIISNINPKIKALKKAIRKDSVGHTYEFQANIEFNIRRNTHMVKATNVLGYIEGTDLKEEVVIISAHMDHLGKQGNTIFYGADDNGSGTSAILEIARVFAEAKKAGNGPRRSILIIAFSGEEKGLLGSHFYTDHPLIAFKKTIADLNIDMIGRVDEKHANQIDYIYLIGSEGLSSSLYKLNEQLNAQYIHLNIDYTFNLPSDPNRFYYRSDQYNFAVHNIPVLFYFNGIHKDYHKPTDTVDKINFNLIRSRAQLVFLTAWSLANAENRAIDKPTLNK
jgi:hypothetical protein